MAGHVHAELMMQYAIDAKTNEKPWELWQFKFNDEKCWTNPKSELTFIHDVDYRRKPKTISINGFDVTMAELNRPEYNDRYFYPSLDSYDLFYTSTWTDHELDKSRLKRGMVYLTKEAAIAHAKALLSFTERKE